MLLLVYQKIIGNNVLKTYSLPMVILALKFEFIDKSVSLSLSLLLNSD